MDNRLEGQWWTRGELGEVVLSNIEYYLINQWDYLGFTRWANDFGIPHSEILMIIAAEQVLREPFDKTFI